MITISELRLTCESYAPYDKGQLVNAIRYSEDATKISAIYDVNVAPHIWFQEYGFIHYKSGRFIDVNQYFIQNDTVGALDYLANTASSGQKDVLLANSKQKLMNRQKQISQGILETNKGNMNRSGSGVLIG